MKVKVPVKRAGKSEMAIVQTAANEYCLRTYGDSFTGGTPWGLSLPAGRVWVVPVVFTSAGYGPVGEVGIVAIEADSLKVMDATPKAEVRSAGARLAREKRHELDAAFHRARAT
jgi:hypothetical protein